MALTSNTVLENRYQIHSKLGEGGMGAVYRAWDTRLDQWVAIKENALATRESADQFQREAKMLAHLHHGNLPRVIDHFVASNGSQYLVMDYIEGEDLAELLKRRGPMPEAQAVAWIDKVGDALAYLHAQRPPIIHRDVKPNNIKLTPQGAIYLVDFGIAKMGDAQARTSIGARGVTPGFSPPEQYGGGTGPYSDVYALGATLYALLTGQTPPDSSQRLLGAAPLPPPRALRPDLSHNVVAALDAALQPRPADRPQTVNVFRQMLQARAPVAPAPSPWAPSAPPPVSPTPSPTPSAAPADAKKGLARLPQWLRVGLIAVAGLLVLSCLCIAAVSLLPGDADDGDLYATPTRGSVASAVNTATPTARPASADPTSTPRATATLSPSDNGGETPGGLVLYEPFSGAESEARWVLPDLDMTEYVFEKGRLVATHSDPDSFSWASSVETYDDMDLEVEMTTLEGGELVGLGLLFGIDEDNENYTGCVIFGDDSAYCLDKVDGEVLFGEWMGVEVNASPLQADVVRLVRIGAAWAMYLNGQCIGAGDAAPPTGGEIGLVISSEDAGTVKVAYDELSIRWPDAESRALLGCTPTLYESAPGDASQNGGSGGGGGNTLTFLNQTADKSCHFELWGPASYSLDVGAGGSDTRASAPSGEYGWKAFITDVGESSANAPANLRAGGGCTFTCYEEGGSYYTHHWCD
jgi:serine/threonine protein kinase